VTKRPVLVTILAIVYALAGVMVIVLESVVLIGQTLPNQSYTSALQMAGLSMIVLPQWAILVYAGGFFALAQGYGFWSLKAWSWWLYVGFVIARLGSVIFFPGISSRPLAILGDIVVLMLLLYLIMRRDIFHLKIPSWLS